MNGRRYYGRDPSQQLMQFYEQNPFYNPFSPSPDIGAGLSGMLQMALTNRQLMKEQEEVRKQQEFENMLAEREMRVRERPEPERERAVSEWQAKWQLAAQKAQTGEWTPEQAENYILGIKPEKEKERKKWAKATTSQIIKALPEYGYTEEDIAQMDDAQIQDLLNEAQARGRKPEAENKQVVSDNKLLDDTIKRYGDEITKLRSGGAVGTFKSKNEIENLGATLDFLYLLKSLVGTSGLSESQRKDVKALLSSLERAKKEGLGIITGEAPAKKTYTTKELFGE